MSERKLGPLEQDVITSLAHPDLSAGATGVTVSRHMSSVLNREHKSGMIYTVLSRLEDKGVLGSFWVIPNSVKGGRRQRLYVLAKGQHT